MSVCADVAADPVHEEMLWLNAEAERNIAPIEVTFSVFQLPMSWLNEVPLPGPINIKDISVTFDVSQLPMSWLNLNA